MNCVALLRSDTQHLIKNLGEYKDEPISSLRRSLRGKRRCATDSEYFIRRRCCIQHISPKVPKGRSRPGVAKDWRFSLCRRDYPRYLPPSIQEALDPPESRPICWLAVCHCESALHRLESEAKTCDAIAGGHIYERNRGIGVCALYIGKTGDSSPGTPL